MNSYPVVWGMNTHPEIHDIHAYFVEHHEVIRADVAAQKPYALVFIVGLKCYLEAPSEIGLIRLRIQFREYTGKETR